MAIQSREIYNTGDPNTDRALARIAERLDVLEGLRPDQDGLIEIDDDKDVGTLDAADLATQDDIDDLGTMAAQDKDDVDITGGKIKITDSNDTTIHQFGED